MHITISNDNPNLNYISITDLDDADIFKTLEIDELKIGDDINLKISIASKNIEIKGTTKRIDTETKSYNSTKGFIKIRNTIIDFK